MNSLLVFILTRVDFVIRHSDRTKERFWHICIPFAVSIVGNIITMCTMNTAARYVGMWVPTISLGIYFTSLDAPFKLLSWTVSSWLYLLPRMDQVSTFLSNLSPADS